uniref:ATP synthase complex subunit 8 n=1 Tax=Henicus brevimucronatus TaxID=1395732 RepID=A0A0N7AS22_9ORTH|nr:ATP synthase F0 subunit 8 [Henicus brevimucronatus]AJW76397.1 ATP synthase F0 subunit 8 [Henicus brevimucronatus]
MPQMAPISWLTLFLMFSITLILFSTLNYFLMSSKSPSILDKKILSQSFNWKW